MLFSSSTKLYALCNTATYKVQIYKKDYAWNLGLLFEFWALALDCAKCKLTQNAQLQDHSLVGSSPQNWPMTTVQKMPTVFLLMNPGSSKENTQVLSQMQKYYKPNHH